MVKRALTLLTSILIALPLLMPFNILAENVGGSSPIIGVNISVIDLNYGKVVNQGSFSLTTNQTQWRCTNSHSTMGCQVWQSQNTSGTTLNKITGTENFVQLEYQKPLYQYEFIFDKAYVGYVSLSNSVGASTSKKYFVNGTSFTVSGPEFVDTISVSSYELRAIPNGMTMWQFPIESFTVISTAMGNLTLVDYLQDTLYIYPFFEFSTNDTLFHINVRADDQLLLIYFISARFNRSNFERYFTWGDGTIDSYEYIRSGIYNGFNGTFYKVKITYPTEGFKDVIYTGPNTYNFIPVYGYSDLGNVSLDFALTWGLKNPIIDDLNLIANGTNESSSAADSSQSANEQLQTDSNTLFSQEDNFKSDMQNAMQNVNNTFRLQDMGTKFVSSAQWVRMQYEQLTNNTPFASLITFSLITGLALILLGKVYR